MKKALFLAVASVALSAASFANLLIDPGFEAFGTANGSGAAFPAYPTINNGWSASATDGEVFITAAGRPAHGGLYYADLLQNAGANTNTFWNETSSSFVGYDRCVTLFAVTPNTTYDFSFWHAGGDRFGYTAFTTLVQIQSMNTTQATSMSFATPGLYQWSQVAAQFTTDGGTTQLALQFSPMGAGNASTLIDDINFAPVPEPFSLAVLSFGVGALVARRRRRKL